MDCNPDIVRDIFALSDSSGKAMKKVHDMETLKPGGRSYYKCVSKPIFLPEGVSLEQALAVLKAVGLKVLE